ncbi:MAG: carbohydrate kinase [Clostridia bacterium]|nr:carbohydrate kinase [Clostridia bacterium]
MSKTYDVIALGEALIDFTPAGLSAKGLPLYEANPGGAPANVLACVNKLGGRACFIGKVGDDAHGRFLTDNMARYGVDLAGLRIDREIPTTLAFVTLDEKGDRSFSFYRKPGADLMLRESELDACLLCDCRIFHFGSVSLTADPARTATFVAAREAKRDGAMISFDPNYRPLLWESEDAAVMQMKRGAEIADIVKVSDNELVMLTGTDDLSRGADALLDMGATLALVSMGAGGSYIATRKYAVRLPTYDVATVDTTGAGDAFLGCILKAVCDMTLDEIADLDPFALQDILDRANACGSLTTTKTGAAPALPADEEIEECRKTVKYIGE